MVSIQQKLLQTYKHCFNIFEIIQETYFKSNLSFMERKLPNYLA